MVRPGTFQLTCKNVKHLSSREIGGQKTPDDNDNADADFSRVYYHPSAVKLLATATNVTTAAATQPARRDYTDRLRAAGIYLIRIVRATMSFRFWSTVYLTETRTHIDRARGTCCNNYDLRPYRFYRYVLHRLPGGMRVKT